jgi:hypothetical protein
MAAKEGRNVLFCMPNKCILIISVMVHASQDNSTIRTAHIPTPTCCAASRTCNPSDNPCSQNAPHIFRSFTTLGRRPGCLLHSVCLSVCLAICVHRGLGPAIQVAEPIVCSCVRAQIGLSIHRAVLKPILLPAAPSCPAAATSLSDGKCPRELAKPAPSSAPRVCPSVRRLAHAYPSPDTPAGRSR